MGISVRTAPCPQCREQGRDTAGDNLHFYEDEDGNDAGAFCHACGYVLKSSSDADTSQLNYKKQEKILEEKVTRITEEQKQAVKDRTGFVDYRGIRADTAKFFGCRYEINEDTGEVDKMYYPVTIKGELVGYKIRKHPKTFIAPVGYCGKEADMGGQFRFTSGSRTVMAVAGEIDQLSAYQMLRDYQARAGKLQYEPTAVVTGLVGEMATATQVKKQYAFFNQFKKIIICLDNDAVGTKATEKLIGFLPKGKVFLMSLDKKDPNEYLKQGLEREFIDAFFRAKQHVPAGIVSSSELYGRLLETAALPKIPLPPFLKKLEGMMAGGIPLKYIVNLGAGTGAAKTTVVNECIRYWVMHSPYKVGIVSCELDAGQYGEAMLSRHLEKKIALIANQEEKMHYLESDEVKKAALELFVDEDGGERFSLVDDRDGTIEQVREVVEEMIVTCGCQLIVIDPIQDLIGNASNEEQGAFMQWQKGLLKRYGVTIINVSHLKKRNGPADTEQLVMPTEDDFHGSSTIIKSGGCNVLMARNKYAEDPIERNTTYLMVSKLRWTGTTGPAGKLYYDNEKHMLYDFDDYFETNVPASSDFE